MGKEGDERKRGGTGVDGGMCSHLFSGRRGGGNRCGVHTNHVPLFSAIGARDGLTKAHQMDQAGLRSPQKKWAVMKTTFFHTKTLCSHGCAWLHVRRDPFARSIALFQSHSLACPHLVSSLFLLLDRSPLSHPFSSAPMFVSERIFAYLPSQSHIFVSHFQEMRIPRQVIHK